jgi:hypothetical protein
MKYDLDGIYRNTPPKAPVAPVKSGKIGPCKAFDLGCGTGIYICTWLA